MHIRRYFYFVLFTTIVFSTACWEDPVKKRPEGPVNHRDEPINFSNKNVSDLVNANASPEKSPEENKEPKTGFMANLPEAFEMPTDDVGRKLLREYGAVFVARGRATPPEKVIFRDEGEVSRFQSSLATVSASIGGFTLELQSPAMAALQDAVKQARTKSLSISPRGADSAKRTYNETVSLWNSRVDPALKHWVGKGRLTQADADRIRGLSTFEQITEVLKLEEKGIYFAKDLSKSIIYSVAPPGTSQHLSLLAFDVKEFDNAEVRSILADNGWFQTVASDLPHFTYLGVKKSELSGLGLKKVTESGRTFWVPDI